MRFKTVQKSTCHKSERIKKKNFFPDGFKLNVQFFCHFVTSVLVSSIYESVAMNSASISTTLQNMDVGGSSSGGGGGGGGANMEDAMQNFIKNHVLSNPITCESTKTK